MNVYKISTFWGLVRNMMLFFLASGFVLMKQAAAGPDPCNPSPIIYGVPYEIEVLHPISSIAQPPCATMMTNEAWYELEITSSDEIYIDLAAVGNSFGGIAIYSGNCASPVLVDCVEDDYCGSEEEIQVLFEGLAVNQVYYLRIWTTEVIQDNTFSLLVKDEFVDIQDFTLIDDAVATTYNNQDCIQLTSNSTDEGGCAWRNEFITFAEPFRHDMYIYLGTMDADGADGICLVYQNGFIDPCGQTGSGIGAEGILQSIIIEFDTWENPDLNDPVDDHVALNLNGNMNHNSSLVPPILVDNLEDGQAHLVSFVWDPATMEYYLELDGVELFRDNYDFINLVFGGDPEVQWGYTSSTGAATNQQYVCPEVINVFQGSMDTVDVEICEGNSYFAGGANQTETGTYQDVYAILGGCDSIIITNLTVLDSVILELDTMLCSGGCIEIAGQTICEAGASMMFAGQSNGCDSFVHVQVSHFDVNLVLDGPILPILCNRPTVELSVVVLNSNLIPEYVWQGPNQQYDGESIDVSEAGTYTVFAFFNYNGQICTTDTLSIEVPIDTMQPEFIYPDGFLTCANEGYLVEDINNDLVYILSDANGVDLGPLPFEIQEPGVYIVSGIDADNGCIGSASLTVTQAEAPEIIAYTIDSVSCNTPGAILIDSVTAGQTPYEYSLNMGAFQTSNLFMDVPAGQHQVIVMDANMCRDTLNLFLPSDTTSPMFTYPNGFISCSDVSYLVEPIDDVLDYSIYNLSGMELGPLPYEVFTSGVYFIFGEDEEGCIGTSSLSVIQAQPPAIHSYTIDTANCRNLGSILIDSIIGGQAPFNYSLNGNSFQVENQFTDVAAGAHYLVLMDANDCTDTLSFEIPIDTLRPEFNYPDRFLNCSVERIEIEALDDTLAYTLYNSSGMALGSLPYSITSAGTYFVEGQNVRNGCMGSSTFVVSRDAAPNIESFVVDSIRCDSLGKIEISEVSDGATPYSYSLNGGIFGEENIFTNLDSGLFTVVVRDVNMCTDTLVVQLNNPIPLVVDYTVNPIGCNDLGSIEIDAVSNGTSPYTYSLNDGIFGEENIFTNLSEGLYKLVVMDRFTCADTFFVELNNPDPLVANYTIVPLGCDHLGAIEVDQVLNGIPPFTYSLNGGTFGDENVLTNLQEGSYTVVVMDANRCTDTFNVDLEGVDDITVQIASPIYMDLGDSVLLNPVVNTTDLNSVQYIWTPSEYLHCSACSMPLFTGGTTSSLLLTAENSFGCTDTASVLIIVQVDTSVVISVDTTVYVPNAISPNDDGVNDRFLVYAQDPINFHVDYYRIFNRWGDKVYEVLDRPLLDLYEVAWDGSFNDEALDPAVFVYSIGLTSNTGKTFELKGSLTIIK